MHDKNLTICSGATQYNWPWCHLPYIYYRLQTVYCLWKVGKI